VSHKKNRLMIQIEYLGAKLIISTIRAVSWKVSLRLARAAAWLVYQLDARHRRVADENLKAAYGDAMSPDERDRITRQVYRHFAEMSVEIIKMRQVADQGKWMDHVEYNVPQEVWDVFMSPKGVLFLSGHLGNFEVAAASIGARGVRGYGIARPMDNPLLGDLIDEMRLKSGFEVLPHRGTIPRMVRILREGGNIGLLIDQDAGQDGVFVPFFGRPASTTPAVAAMALKTGCAIIMGFAFRKGDDLKFEMRTIGPLYPESTGDRDADILRITADITRRLEEVVRERPERWLWLHRRWKTQP